LKPIFKEGMTEKIDLSIAASIAEGSIKEMEGQIAPVFEEDDDGTIEIVDQGCCKHWAGPSEVKILQLGRTPKIKDVEPGQVHVEFEVFAEITRWESQPDESEPFGVLEDWQDYGERYLVTVSFDGKRYELWHREDL
jgi:hypothetical protein